MTYCDTFTSLAQYSNWKRMGDGLYGGRGSTESGEVVLYVLAAVLAVVLAGIIYAHRKTNELTQTCNNPRKLFRDLCQIHEIDYRDKRLLRHLAEARLLGQPAEVFVTPHAFDASDLPPHLRDKEEQLRKLRERLF